MKCYSLICIISLLFSSFSLQAKSITVAIEPLGYPPYYFNEKGNIKGAAVEILEHLAKQLNHTIHYEQYPWSRMQYYLQKGKIDMLLVYLKTPERAYYTAFPSTPIFYETYYFYALADAPTSFNGDLHSITGLNVGEVRGYSYGKEYDDFTLINRFQVGSEGQLIRMLLKKRVDLIIADQAVIDDHLKQLNIEDKIQKLPPRVAKAPAYFAFSKRVPGNEALAKAYSRALDAFITTKQYQDILMKYQIEGSE